MRFRVVRSMYRAEVSTILRLSGTPSAQSRSNVLSKRDLVLLIVAVSTVPSERSTHALAWVSVTPILELEGRHGGTRPCQPDSSKPTRRALPKASLVVPFEEVLQQAHGAHSLRARASALLRAQTLHPTGSSPCCVEKIRKHIGMTNTRVLGPQDLL